MGRGLPNHLATLLKHRAPDQPEVAAATKETGRAARRRAARSKRKIQKAETANQEKKAKEAKKQIAQAVATPVAAQETPQPLPHAERTLRRAVKKRKAKPEGTKSAKRAKAAPAKQDDALKANQTAALFDPEGAARDEALLRKLEKNLGIAGDAAKRKKEERRIFEALGFDTADAGIEEPPSSDEQGPEEIPSSTRPTSVSPENNASAEAMASLIETILGGTSSQRSGPTAKKLMRGKMKSSKRARGPS